MKAVVILPTYNEKNNILRILDAIFDLNSNIENFELNVLVVDGDSFDGTALLVENYILSNSKVFLLSEKKRSGLGGAYLCGMREAINNMGADVVIEMDADFQHDPKDISKLLSALNNGFDFAVGSRFIKGGSIPKSWAVHRKMLSFFGNFYLRAVSGLWKYHDITSGFRATRVKNVLEKVDLERLRSKNFAYKIDLYHKILLTGAKAIEIPINFLDRGEGDSKQSSIPNLLDSLRVATLISFERHGTFLKIGFVGGVGFFVNLFVLIICVEWLDFGRVFSNVISAEVSILSNFLINNFWTFKNYQPQDLLISNFIKFNLGSGVSILIQILCQFLGGILFGHSHYILYTTLGVFLGWFWNYFFYSNFVWKKNA